MYSISSQGIATFEKQGTTQMYKIEVDKAQNMIAVIEEHHKVPKDILIQLEKAVEKHVTTGETKDFYQGFLSAISLLLELQGQGVNNKEMNAK